MIAKSGAYGGLCLVISGWIAAGCAGGFARATSPWERYAGELTAAGLDGAALGQDWLRAGERALADAVVADLPFHETGYFPSGSAQAIGYRVELPRGRRLAVELTFETLQPGRVFVDLFRIDNAGPRLVASMAHEETTLTYDVEQDGAYVLRVQPELLRGGRYTLAERTLASLPFPVSGLSASSVRSQFGAARNGGSRSHEGVDIFAARGTPALAVVDGVARADTNALGGNVVWLHDRRERRTFYYAHLDGWQHDGTLTVRRGDVVGFVGNTGNARTTSPHLHFGIYDGGPIDPLPFLEPDDTPARRSPLPVDYLDTWVRVTAARAPLRAGARPAAANRQQLERHTVAKVIGLAGRTLRVRLPDDAIGYLDVDQTSRTTSPVRRAQLAPGTFVRERPLPAAPVVTTIASAAAAEVLGSFGGFDLIRVGTAVQGWTSR